MLVAHQRCLHGTDSQPFAASAVQEFVSVPLVLSFMKVITKVFRNVGRDYNKCVLGRVLDWLRLFVCNNSNSMHDQLAWACSRAQS